MEIQETPTPTPRKSRLAYIISGIVLVLLLVGAAFIGGRLLNSQGFQERKGSPANMPQPAKELPQTPADVAGVFDHRQDNSIFISTGQVMVTTQKDNSGNVESASDNDGPTVEVVVTAQTTIYKDVTMKQFDGPPPEGQQIQQVVEPGSLDEIGESSMITVWGRRTGDRIIADVLVYSPPAFITK